MDIISEIHRLPQYYYMLKNGEIILGGTSSRYDTEYDKANNHRSSMDRLFQIWDQIMGFYKRDGEREILSDEEKKEYAQLVYKMKQHSEGKKIARDELIEIINKLSNEDRQGLEWQIDMYKRGQRYYTEYIHRK